LFESAMMRVCFKRVFWIGIECFIGIAVGNLTRQWKIMHLQMIILVIFTGYGRVGVVSHDYLWLPSGKLT
jgi:hypothetical protein